MKGRISDPERKRCPNCRVAGFCGNCVNPHLSRHEGSSECKTLRAARREGRYNRIDVSSVSVAIKKPIFGEGAERIVKHLRFIDDAFTFLPGRMVAKELRFTDASNHEIAFHANLMRTQALASRLAERFNQDLDSLEDQFKDHRRWVRQMPRLEFLKPYVIEIDTATGLINVLTEPFLDGHYEKFNNNAGYIKGQARKTDDEILGNLEDKLNELNIIAEGDEEDEYSDDDEEGPNDKFNNSPCIPAENTSFQIEYDPRTYPQAFSHYSYEKSKRELIVVDLQGTFNETYSDGAGKFILTDPAIHHRKKTSQKRWQFGRTGKGKKGIRAFFETHTCCDTCRLLGLKPIDPRSIQV